MTAALLLAAGAALWLLLMVLVALVLEDGAEQWSDYVRGRRR